MPEDIVRRMSEGLEVEGLRAYAKRISQCGLKGTVSLEVYLGDGLGEEPLMHMTACPGALPYYRPWIEAFCINPHPRGIGYYDSSIETSVLKVLSESLGPGGKVFLEYYPDHETSCCLAMGFPPALTRQGYRLLEYGFTWFKDWYFSEGGHEGGQKIQGEKPLHERAREKHMLKIQAEATDFLERWQCTEGDIKSIMDGTRDRRVYVRRALKRAEAVLRR